MQRSKNESHTLAARLRPARVSAASSGDRSGGTACTTRAGGAGVRRAVSTTSACEGSLDQETENEKNDGSTKHFVQRFHFNKLS